jgi:hypothetical protein
VREVPNEQNEHAAAQGPATQSAHTGQTVAVDRDRLHGPTAQVEQLRLPYGNHRLTHIASTPCPNHDNGDHERNSLAIP